MRTAAYILMIVITVVTAFFIIPMCWMIPMTLSTKRAINDKKEHIALGVCMLLFCGILPGILMLISKGTEN
jgi:hypothetical protein